MPILSSNEKYTRELCSRLSVMTGLPYNAVRAVIDGVELCLLEDMRKQSLEHDTNEKATFSLELPNIGTLKLSTHRYPEDMSVILGGNSFKSGFTISKKFLNRLRWAYYDSYDYLTERTMSNFKELFAEHYKSIVQDEEGD